jgi:hypothetical protein
LKIAEKEGENRPGNSEVPSGWRRRCPVLFLHFLVKMHTKKGQFLHFLLKIIEKRGTTGPEAEQALFSQAICQKISQ